MCSTAQGLRSLGRIDEKSRWSKAVCKHFAPQVASQNFLCNTSNQDTDQLVLQDASHLVPQTLASRQAPSRQGLTKKPTRSRQCLCAHCLGDLITLLPPLSLTTLAHSQRVDDPAIKASLCMVGHSCCSCGRLALCKQARSSACSSRSSFCHAAASALQEQILADAAA